MELVYVLGEGYQTSVGERVILRRPPCAWMRNSDHEMRIRRAGAASARWRCRDLAALSVTYLTRVQLIGVACSIFAKSSIR